MVLPICWFTCSGFSNVSYKGRRGSSVCNTTTIGWSSMDEVGSVFVETVDLIPSRVSSVVIKDFIDL